jgi:flagellin
MSTMINTNVASLTAQNNLRGAGMGLNTTIQRLSSGLRINGAKDDAAGLQITQGMTAQIRGLDQASRNSNDAISLSQTAEGALSTTQDMLQRIRELAVQSANGSNTQSDRTALQAEVTQLSQEITRISSTTQFNGQNILDGTFTQQFQVGANANQTLSVGIGNASSAAIGSFRTQQLGLATASNTASSSTAFASGNITISSALGTATTTTIANNASAGTIATAINAQTSTTGVTAQAITEATLTVNNAGVTSFTLRGSNATAVNITASVTATDASGLADAINQQSANTGITAVNTGGQVTLRSETGEDIRFASASGGATFVLQGRDAFAGTTAGAAGVLGSANATATVGGLIQTNSQSAFTVTASAAAANNSGYSTTAVASSLNAVSAISITTVAGSNSAVSVVDAALARISSQRAAQGAIQNRMESTIRNLNNTSDNVNSARSRIRDADYAKETASLSRNQVLQQAGTAVLAQANQLSQNVLSLLRG